MEKKNQFTLNDLRNKGFIQDETGAFVKGPVSNNNTLSLFPPEEIPDGFRKVSFSIFGEPVPKQSVKQGRNFKTGQKVFYHDSEIEKAKTRYINAIKAQIPKDFVMFTQIVYVTKLHFIYAPLKGFSKSTMDSIKSGELIPKTTRPDVIDNLKKLLFDSLSGIVFKDDGIVTGEDNVRKFHGTGGLIIIELKGK